MTTHCSEAPDVLWVPRKILSPTALVTLVSTVMGQVALSVRFAIVMLRSLGTALLEYLSITSLAAAMPAFVAMGSTAIHAQQELIILSKVKPRACPAKYVMRTLEKLATASSIWAIQLIVRAMRDILVLVQPAKSASSAIRMPTRSVNALEAQRS